MDMNPKRINEKYILFSLIGIMLTMSLIISGCIANSEIDQTNQSSEIASPTDVESPTITKIPQSIEQNEIKELENKINSMQMQITDLQTRLDRIGLPTPSNKSLIPSELPFAIEIRWAEFDVPMRYTFEGSQVEIRDSYGDTYIAAYNMDYINNTIEIRSKQYDYYGIVLYDDYITGIYENGWIGFAKQYKIVQRYNTFTRKYEV